jgi:hypothetical protein
MTGHWDSKYLNLDSPYRPMPQSTSSSNGESEYIHSRRPSANNVPQFMHDNARIHKEQSQKEIKQVTPSRIVCCRMMASAQWVVCKQNVTNQDPKDHEPSPRVGF